MQYFELRHYWISPIVLQGPHTQGKGGADWWGLEGSAILLNLGRMGNINDILSKKKKMTGRNMCMSDFCEKAGVFIFKTSAPVTSRSFGKLWQAYQPTDRPTMTHGQTGSLAKENVLRFFLNCSFYALFHNIWFRRPNCSWKTAYMFGYGKINPFNLPQLLLTFLYPFDRLVGWSVDYLVGRLVGRSVGLS